VDGVAFIGDLEQWGRQTIPTGSRLARQAVHTKAAGPA
jgi:hypothetical protein